MKASLDTNVLIHLYRAGFQHILFDFFDEGVCIYEQIRKVELENHGKDILDEIDADIAAGKIDIYTDEKLKEQCVYHIFANNVNDNKYLYNPEDLGEVYAISLAQTIGAYSLVTDDIKRGGPYMSLLNFESDIMPFTFVDILILMYLIGLEDEVQTIDAFNAINVVSNLKWDLRSHIKRFIRRFYSEPYNEEDKRWIKELEEKYKINTKRKLTNLNDKLK